MRKEDPLIEGQIVRFNAQVDNGGSLDAVKDPLSEFKDKSGEIRQGEFVRVGLDTLNTVVQSRMEYSDIEGLARNIAQRSRLIHPILVSVYDREGAQGYLDTAYAAYGDKIPNDQRKTVDDLFQSTFQNREVYPIVISGHRRLRALRLLGVNDIVVQVIEDEDPLDALEDQASENTASPPKDYERAESNGSLYAIKKLRNPKLSPTQFAEGVGYTDAIVKRDLLYYSLPDAIKDFVVPRGRIDDGVGDTFVPDQPLMPFNVACQLGRLVKAGASEYDLLFLARNFFKENITSEETASKRVSAYIKSTLKGPTGNMLDVFQFNMADLKTVMRARQLADSYAFRADEAASYFDRTRILRELGLADEGDENLSFAAAASRLAHLAVVVERVLPYFESAFKPEEVERIRSTFSQLHEMSENMEVRIGDVS